MQIEEFDPMAAVHLVSKEEPCLVAAKLCCDRSFPTISLLPNPHNEAGFGSSVYEVSHPYGLDV